MKSDPNLTQRYPLRLSREVSRSVNDLLDLEADRAMEMLKNIVAIKPMKESEVNALGVRALECLCEDLVPSSVLDGEALDVEEHAPLYN
jgi:hypothetical protein